MDEIQVTPRSKTTENEKGSASKVVSVGKDKTVGTSGPGGRERKRAVKIEELERRRARDAKFGVGRDESEASDDDVTRSPRRRSRRSRSSSRHSRHSHGLGHEIQPDLAEGLPEQFAGQEIEDLHYGAGPAEIEMEREVINGWWDGEEDEEMFISHLSGSEADRQSQSSVSSDSDDPMSGSEDASTSDEELDEFGFPLPSQDNGAEAGPLVLMENWDGQFVLVQPRQDRSQSRRHGSRGSRTAGSVGASTTFSVGTGAEGGEQLLIDPDAMDPSSESEWSGLTEESDEGDTTDSMAEEDMPMLDSPALDQLIGEQMANVSMGVAVKPAGPMSSISSGTNSAAPSILNGLAEVPVSTPAIVVTDASGDLVAASTPGPSTQETPLPAAPTMGTFHPTTTHPSQHAVIDGSNTPTKSPFTHRRRSRTKDRSVRGRSDSFPSIASRDERERKRKTLQYDADHFAIPDIPKRLRYSSIPGHPRFIAAKRAAMSDMDMEDTPSEEDDQQAGPEEVLDLEDMLEESILSPTGHDDDDDDQEEGGFRFDRVPVSRYLKRHFGTGSKRGSMSHGPGSKGAHGHQHHLPQHHSTGHTVRSWSMPTSAGVGVGPGITEPMHQYPFGLTVGSTIGGLDHTLAGPVGRMMLLSPGLAPVHEDRSGVLSRKEKRRKRRRAMGALATGQDIPELAI
ncbi:hypothetical protein BD324DRAFT_607673 [Kockovaella imperatae]|uniref:Uncharacterized protein n=1 Tax=Kockovaella imperatae TaxID=4999 RepID=A0A1Y1UMT2_9TREE|nr:hypothetical protein BD324DRAFT_607673 [Kockovaella imperatae]ORX39360.1 hypothetical protein BD324DRAFT_607673 [Kockovaella imperatae]